MVGLNMTLERHYCIDESSLSLQLVPSEFDTPAVLKLVVDKVCIACLQVFGNILSTDSP